MRLWTLHPSYLDAKGLVAAWREALLAQKVLEGLTKGYARHPQLERFRSCEEPLTAIGAFLGELAAEGERRGYSFDASKIRRPGAFSSTIPVEEGQVDYEFELLKAKLKLRDPDRFAELCDTSPIRVASLFVLTSGGIASWERPLPEIYEKVVTG